MMMSSKTMLQAIAVATMVMASAPAFAQTGGSPGQGGHNMPGMDMTAMMKQCSQMRQQMQPGMQMPPNMQAMMRQCDAMDQQMAAPSGTAAPPHPRTR